MRSIIVTMEENANIVIVGGANIEYIITSKKKIVQGAKNSVDIEELYGGSGVNYTLRLLHTGEKVYPILFLGDDHAGRQIQREIAKALIANDPKIRYFIEEKEFFIPSVQTPKSTIIVEGTQRTILTHDKNEKNIFRSFVAKRLKSIENCGALIIGHIHNDKPALCDRAENLSTIFSIKYFSDKKTLIYANFGASQLDHGFSFWREYLKSIDILQLNICEIKKFFKFTIDNPTLNDVLETLKKLNISAIITLDKFGALGILKDHQDTIFMARPVELGDKFIDSTGAGDAFCAGMVSVLNGKKRFTQNEFKEAMQTARSWAVYACTSYGGANKCPSAEAIETFHQSIVRKNEVLMYRGERIKDLTALIDITIELHEI